MSDWTELDTRRAVKGRSGGICELCQSARATDMHHRKSAGTGGQWRPSNIVHICRACHRDATANPMLAYIAGVSLQYGDDPEATPVMRDDGSSFQPTDDVLKAGPRA